jgi:hypothetical protein
VHQYARPWSGRVLGLTAILTAAGLACGSGLPALAAPAAHAAPAARAAAARGSTARVLLITGDRLLIHSQGSRRQIAAQSANRADPMISMRHGSSITEVPAAALPYLGHGLSPALFQLATLEKAESGGRLPVRVTFSGSLPAIPGLTITQSGAGSATGYLTAASARAFGAALMRQYAADHATGRFGTDGLFGRDVSISPAGAGPVAAARPRAAAGVSPGFKMHTLTVRGRNLAGQPDTGDDVFISSADDIGRFDGLQENDNFFYKGVAKFSMPAGHYWAFVSFFSVSSTGHGSLRMVVVPQFTVAGAHSVLRVAEKSASSKVTMATPRRTTNFQTTFEVDRFARNGTEFSFSFGWGAGLPAWVSPTTRKPTVGTLHTYTSATLTSPARVRPTYAYNLDFPGPAGIVPPQHFSAGPATTATVTERYYQDVATKNGAWVSFGGTVAQLSFEFLELAPIRMPQQQTQYFTASPRIMWSNETWTNINQFAGGDTDDYRVYQPGHKQTQDWNRYPLHPAQDTTLGGLANAFPTFTSAARLGNKLELSQTPWSDNQFGHLGPGFFGNGSAPTTGTYVIDQNGTEIAHGNAVNGIPLVKLSAQPSTIRYTLSASRTSSFYRLSPSSTTAWTWHSRRATAARVPKGWICGFEIVHNQFRLNRKCAVQPLLTLQYLVHGLSLSGQAKPGAQAVSLTVGHIQLGGKAAIKGATAQVSYNDGDSWQPATVTAHGGGRFGISYHAPAGVDVSLRVTDTDAAGGSISETIIRGYGVSQ